MTATLTAAPRCLRDVLAEALWIAHCWYDDPGFPDPAKAALYEELHDAAVTAPSDETAWNRLVAAFADGTAELGDLTALSLDGFALAGITAGGDAGTEDEINAAGVTA